MSKSPPFRAQAAAAAGPFSRPLDVDRVPDTGQDVAIEATAAERVAIVADLGLAGLAALTASFQIEKRAGGRLAVEGHVHAAITQICIITLEPFDSLVEQTLELSFAPSSSAAAVDVTTPRSRRREPESPAPSPRPVIVPGNDDQVDPPDPIVDGRIDLGAIALEFLTLSLDLYPRRPGVRFDDVSVGETSEDDATGTPFAALQRLKDRS